MSSGAVHYFVYYRIAAGRRNEARACVAAILAGIEQRLGVVGRAFERREDGATWMEVYEAITDSAAFETTLSALVDATCFSRVLADDAARTIERFVALDAPRAAAR